VDNSDLLHAGITEAIIGAFFEVYNNLGYGFLEFPYSLAMERELIERKRSVGREVAVPLFYKYCQLCTYRLDMLVDHQVIVEIKSGADLP
jgi:GxxExxY protein